MFAKATDEVIECRGRRTTVALDARAVLTKAGRCHAGRVDTLGCDLKPVNGSRMGHDHCCGKHGGGQCRRPGAIVRTLAPLPDVLAAIGMSDVNVAMVAIERGERHRPSVPEWFPCGSPVGILRLCHVGARVRAGHGRSVWRQPLIDEGHGLTGLFPGVVLAQERIARVAAISP